jgi:C4-dicarboxylate-specific signal transduction histidine kinase
MGQDAPTTVESSEETRRALISMLDDINDQKLALQEAYDQLKETTAQMVQNEKLTALGEMTAGIAHELNQPLNCIKVMAQSNLRDMERNRLEARTMQSDLAEIVKQVDRMAEIINHMRIFTRKQVGVVRSETDLNTVIEGPFKLLGQQLQIHGIEVVRELTPGLPVISTDAIQLEQVLLNLISNAKDALGQSKKEPKRITIRSGLREGTPRRVVLTIADTGGGVPADIRNKIFDPFFTTKEPGKGTGLGLSISKKIISYLGGQIELTVREGEGSDFSVVLPIPEA